MKIRRKVDGVSAGSIGEKRKLERDKEQKTRENQADTSRVDVQGRVSLDLAKEINRIVTEGFDEEDRSKRVAELKEKYRQGKLSDEYDSTAVAQAFVNELSEL